MALLELPCPEPLQSLLWGMGTTTAQQAWHLQEGSGAAQGLDAKPPAGSRLLPAQGEEFLPRGSNEVGVGTK